MNSFSTESLRISSLLSSPVKYYFLAFFTDFGVILVEITFSARKEESFNKGGSSRNSQTWNAGGIKLLYRGKEETHSETELIIYQLKWYCW